MQTGSFGKKRKTFSYTTRSSFLKRVQSGNDEAWKEFYEKYTGMIRFIGKKRQLTSEECDDLQTEVMVIFWKKMNAFLYDPARGKFRSYLGRIANLAAFRIYKKNHGKELMNVPLVENYPADINVDYMEEWQNYLLGKALEDLKNQVDTEIYQVFYRSTIQKRPIEEVVAVTRKTANNIYVIRSRCLKKLRRIIADYRKSIALGE